MPWMKKETFFVITYIDTRLTKAWTAINRLSIIWKSDLTDKMKRSFFQAAVTSILLYGCTTWTLTKGLEKKLDGNYTRMLRAILNKSWWQHPTRHQLYGHLPPITKTTDDDDDLYREKIFQNCASKISEQVWLSQLSPEKPKLSLGTRISSHKFSKRPQEEGKKSRFGRKLTAGCPDNVDVVGDSTGMSPKKFPRIRSQELGLSRIL